MATKKNGRPRAKPGEKRDMTITIAVSVSEMAALVDRAGTIPLRLYMRLVALGQKVPAQKAVPAAAFDLSERLTAIAGDLATLVQAIRSGRVLGMPVHVADVLHEAAHDAALLIIGVRPDAR